MTRTATYFATINKKGEVLVIAEATPAHDLYENQVMLTYKEYQLLRIVTTLDEAKSLLNNINWKINTQLGEWDEQSK